MRSRVFRRDKNISGGGEGRQDGKVGESEREGGCSESST